MIAIKNFIGGEFRGAPNDQIDVYEPASGDVYALLPRSGSQEVEEAVRYAEAAREEWATMKIETRSRILHKIADLIEERQEELARAESKDTGKPLSLASTVDIPRAAANFRFFASAIVNHSTTAHIMEGDAVNYTRRGPIGIVGCISPWNLPLYLFTWKIVPALSMGNCVVAKPSELTPVTAWMLGEICNEAGLPAGVLNILHGYGNEVGQAIVEHPQVKAISFTGGTSTGRTIGRIAADQFKKVSLELGGKNATIVFADCDFEAAVSTAVRSSFANQGEICLCGSRILVEDSIYERFKDAFVKSVSKLKIGDPYNEKTQFGALISEAHKEKILGYIELAKQEGGTILTGGKEVDRAGYFVEPTVIEGLSYDCRVNQEEIFGPVVTIMRFSSEEEALQIANSTTYGLATSVWTSDVNRAHSFTHKLEAGIIWVNCWMLRDLRTPFGGMKNSGVGREGGDEALKFFSETQNVCIKTKP